MKRILLLEDDAALCRGLAIAIETETISVTPCYTVAEAAEQLGRGSFDLAVLDVNLPDGSGLELLRQVRERGSLPVILLTANDTETDMVAGLESGADDYIAKPFSLAVLRARVNAQLRRSGADGGHIYRQDDLQFDFGRMEFRRNGETMDLSRTEQKLLRILVENRARTVPRERLLEAVWPDGTDYVDENALSVSVKRLRDKLGDARYIKTAYGLGYQWVTEHG